MLTTACVVYDGMSMLVSLYADIVVRGRAMNKPPGMLVWKIIYLINTTSSWSEPTNQIYRSEVSIQFRAYLIQILIGPYAGYIFRRSRRDLQ